MDPAKVTSRSNSDLTAIEMIGNNVNMSPEARMAAILDRALDWDAATKGCTGRIKADNEYARRAARHAIYGPLR